MLWKWDRESPGLQIRERGQDLWKGEGGTDEHVGSTETAGQHGLRRGHGLDMAATQPVLFLVFLVGSET